MEASVIRCRLDLLVRLIDTTTGAVVEERNVRFLRDKEQIRPIPRGSGNYVFLNSGREDFTLTVNARGYDICRKAVSYGSLDHQMPVMEVFLIPSENATGQPVLTLSGRLSGMEAIQAVSLGASRCCISEFDERRRIMKLFKTHRSGMDDIYYGLIHLEETSYEPFEVVKEIAADSVKVKEPLKEAFDVKSPIARIIFGRVTEEGDYVLRVRDDMERLIYMVRYVQEGSAKFKIIDFRHLEEVTLE